MTQDMRPASAESLLLKAEKAYNATINPEEELRNLLDSVKERLKRESEQELIDGLKGRTTGPITRGQTSGPMR